MSFHSQTTTFSRLVRAISRGTMLRYPDKVDPSLWKVAIGRYISDGRLSYAQATSQNGSASTDRECAEGVPGKESSASEMDGRVWRQEKSESDRSETVVVDWYGSDDPEVSERFLYSTQSSPITSNPHPIHIPEVYGAVC